MAPMPDEPITATIPDFCRISGLGRNLVYDMLNSGRLQAVRAGRRRLLIVIDSWRREIERQGREGVPEYEPIKTAQEARRQRAAARIDIEALDL